MAESPIVQRYSADMGSFDIGDTKVQHFGLLMKRPFGHKSARWQKRYVITIIYNYSCLKLHLGCFYV